MTEPRAGTPAPTRHAPVATLANRHRWRHALTAAAGAAALAALATITILPRYVRRPLVLAFNDTLVSLDPHLHNHNATWSCLSSLYDPLVALDAELKPVPALASSWRQLEPTRWRFMLRPDVRFHDGSPFGPEDVVASFNRARSHPRSNVAYQIAAIDAIRQADATTIEITTSRPVPDLLGRLSFLAITPRTAPARDEIARPVGTGPYRFVRRRENGSVETTAWHGWHAVPPVERVVFSFASDRAALARDLMGGHIDVLHLVPDALLVDVGRAPGLRLVTQPRLGVQMLALYPNSATGATRQALLDPRTRRAILLALDRQGWVTRLFRGNAIVASQYVHPAVFGYDPAVQPAPYDADAARRLLAAVGHVGELELDLGHTPAQDTVAQAIASELGRVGVLVTLHEARADEVTRMALSGRISAQLFNWACATGDASDFFDRFVRLPESSPGMRPLRSWGVSTAAVETLLGRADAELDPQARLALLQEAQRELLASLPVLPLTLRQGTIGLSSRIEVVTRFDERQVPATYTWRR